MNKRFLKLTSSTAIMAFAAIHALPSAMAQTAPAVEDDGRDVVIVTGTRRDESVQDAPINISAIGSEAIEAQGAEELSDILALVPGINAVDQGPRAGGRIIARGINADPISSEEGVGAGGGTVATYVGEVPVFVDLKLEDLERVEVLLGPQGTLYGAGTLGGAIRYIPRKPDFANDSLEVRSDLYGYSEASDLSYDVSATFNKALTDTLAVRGTLGYLSDSGFIDYPFIVQEIGVSEPDPDFSDPAARAANFAPLEDANGQDMTYGRLAVRWAPAEWLDGTLSYFYQQQDVEGRTISHHLSTVPAGEYESGLRVREPNDRKQELLSLEVTADLGFAELTSATGYGKYEEHGQRDQTDLLITLDYSYEAFPEFAAYTREDAEDEFVTAEVRLVSSTPGPFQWIAGAFYNHAYGFGASREFTPGFNDWVVPNFGFDYRPDALEYYSEDYTHLIEKAFFGEISYDITDTWDVTIGARNYDYTFRTAGGQDFPLLYTGLGIYGPDETDLQLEDAGQERDGWLYKFNTSWKPTEDLLLFATVSEGFRIGNSNGLAPCPDYDPGAPQGSCALAPGQQYGPNPGDIAQFDERQYGPDQTLNYEIGFKSEWLDGDLQVNGSVFYIDWTDPQVSSATVNAAIPITINAKGAESKGIELSSVWYPISDLRLQGSYSYTKAELTEDVPSLVGTISPPGFDTAFEDGLAGDRLPGSPEQQFAFSAEYEQPMGEASLIYRASFYAQDDVLTRTGGRGGGYTLDGYSLLNLSLTYDAGPWAVTGYLKNALDEYYETGARSTPLFNQTINDANVRSFGVYPGAPMMFGVKFRYTFE